MSALKHLGSCRVFCAPFDVKLNDSPLTISSYKRRLSNWSH